MNKYEMTFKQFCEDWLESSKYKITSDGIVPTSARSNNTLSHLGYSIDILCRSHVLGSAMSRISKSY